MRVGIGFSGLLEKVALPSPITPRLRKEEGIRGIVLPAKAPSLAIRRRGRAARSERIGRRVWHRAQGHGFKMKELRIEWTDRGGHR